MLPKSRSTAELAQAETPASITAAEETTIPAPAVSTAYPPIPTADRSDPSAFAIAFATELLDTNYATQSRAALLAWAEHEEAPNTLPGVPADQWPARHWCFPWPTPGCPAGLPHRRRRRRSGRATARRDEVQSVSDLQAEVDPDWTQIISEGWQPRDPRMTIEVVTGTLTVSIDGQAAPLRVLLPHPHAGVIGRTRARRLRRRGGRGLDPQLMACSPIDPAGCLADLAGGAAKSIADSAFGAIAKDFGNAADSAVNWLWGQISGATAISLSGSAMTRDLAIVTTLAVVVATGLFIIQIIASVLRQDGAGLARALKGLLVAFMGSVAAIAITSLLLAAVDALSAGFVQAATGESVHQMGTTDPLGDGHHRRRQSGRRACPGPHRARGSDRGVGSDDGPQAAHHRRRGVRPAGLCRGHG